MSKDLTQLLSLRVDVSIDDLAKRIAESGTAAIGALVVRLAEELATAAQSETDQDRRDRLLEVSKAIKEALSRIPEEREAESAEPAAPKLTEEDYL
ncbi:MAG TPA: hypothetical protein VEQ63_13200 [Bryobacteraceae bacterium]|nr:hypothetical protein [Bryobacteraceae bacterium]